MTLTLPDAGGVESIDEAIRVSEILKDGRKNGYSGCLIAVNMPNHWSWRQYSRIPLSSNSTTAWMINPAFSVLAYHM